MSNTFGSNPFDGSNEVVVSLEGGERPPSDREPSASKVAFERFIRTSDLSVVFQPIVRLATDEVFAYEALVRCAMSEYRDPTRLFERAVRERCVGRLGRAIRSVAVPLCGGGNTATLPAPICASSAR